ncbi:MAG: type I DNA topoisomerase [Acidimicrobiales bacterium]
MNNALIIVESPNKVATIQKILGPGHTVASTRGHFADIPEKKNAVDVDNGYAMEYSLTSKGAAVVDELRGLLAGADELVLATDADREGEMIAHLLVEFLAPTVPVSRVRFNAITADAIGEAMRNRGGIDTRLVEAARARRALDHLVGFRVSPELWATVRGNLSAGRVQSPALHLIVQREMERRSFVSVDYCGITMTLATDPAVSATLRRIDGREVATSSHFAADGSLKGAGRKGVTVLDADAATALAARLGGRPVRVAAVDTKGYRRRAPFPYVTSSFLQDAQSRLGLDAKPAQSALQQLFEKGLITYPRTDSPHMAPHAVTAARNTAVAMFGADAVPPKPRPLGGKVRNAQEAHEAIRPTDFSRRRATGVSTNAARVYELVWQRTVASQMTDATGTTTTVTFEVLTAGNAETCSFVASGTVIDNPGFRRVQPSSGRDEPVMPAFATGHRVESVDVSVSEHRTTPPARYNEASLIAALEKEGVGRPSTYAEILGTLKQRYVWSKRGDKALIPTVTGVAVNQVMQACFAPLNDLGFTGRFEQQLDEVLEGTTDMRRVLDAFWADGSGAGPALRTMIEQRAANFDPRKNPVMEFGVHPVLGEPVTLHGGKAPRSKRARGNPYLKCGGTNVPVADETEIDLLTPEAAFALVSMDRTPRTLGEHEGHEVRLLVGRHGPYVTWNGVNASVPKTVDAAGIDVPAALALLEARTERDRKRAERAVAREAKRRGRP